MENVILSFNENDSLVMSFSFIWNDSFGPSHEQHSNVKCDLQKTRLVCLFCLDMVVVFFTTLVWRPSSCNHFLIILLNSFWCVFSLNSEFTEKWLNHLPRIWMDVLILEKNNNILHPYIVLLYLRISFFFVSL